MTTQDEQISRAKAVQDAATVLNKAISDAARDGIEVTIEVTHVRMMNDPPGYDGRPMITAVMRTVVKV